MLNEYLSKWEVERWASGGLGGNLKARVGCPPQSCLKALATIGDIQRELLLIMFPWRDLINTMQSQSGQQGGRDMSILPQRFCEDRKGGLWFHHLGILGTYEPLLDIRSGPTRAALSSPGQFLETWLPHGPRLWGVLAGAWDCSFRECTLSILYGMDLVLGKQSRRTQVYKSLFLWGLWCVSVGEQTIRKQW